MAIPLSSSWGQTDNHWFGGTGDWNDPNHWSGNFFPNNGSGGTNWNVFIGGGNSNATLNVSPTINQLNVGGGDVLGILNGQTLTIIQNGQTGAGTIHNDGHVFLDGTGASTRILLSGGATQINGSGTISLAGGNNTQIAGSSTLTHGANHTIQGSGNIGANSLRIINLGTLQAGAGDSLILDPVNAGAGTAGLDNQGIVRATGGGMVTMTGSGFGEFHGSGVYQAQDNSSIDLTASAIARNTTFDTSGSGAIHILSNQTIQWYDVTNLGNTYVRDNAWLDIYNSLDNQGEMNLEGGGGNTQLRVANNLQLTGGGTVRLLGPTARVSGFGTSSTLVNVDNTITGTGNVGNNSALIVNQSLIVAGNGDSIVIDPVNAGAGNAGLDNQAVVRATGGGVVTLTGSGFGEFHGSGVYEAQAGSSIDLTTSAIARNTNFNTLGSGAINILSNQTIEWHDVTNLGNTYVRDNAFLDIYNSLDNQGEIILGSSGGNTQLRTRNIVNLTGGGTVRLTDPAASIAGVGGSSTLVNVDNTITGTGNVGNNSAMIVNQSLIVAGSGDSIKIDPVNVGAGNAGFDNQAIVRATGGGVVALTGNGFGEFHGSGVYEALNSSSINLETSAIARDTTFSTSGSGAINILSGHTIQWYDVTNSGNTYVRNNAWLDGYGSLNNEGEVTLVGDGGGTQFRVGGDLELNGGGAVRFSGTTARIGGFGTLVNTDNTITGSGNIGNNAIRVVNHGLIEANSGQTLTVDPVNAGAGIIAFDNASGVVRATGGGVVTLTGSGFGEFGGNGTFEALDDSSIDFDSTAIVQNLAGGTLSSGTWRAVDNGNGANIRIQNNSSSLIHSIGLGAAVELSGANSSFAVRAADVSIDSTLEDLAGQLALRDGRVMNLSGGLTHSGDLFVDGATSKLIINDDFTQSAGSTTLLAGGTLELTGGSNVVSGGIVSGNGTILGDIANLGGLFSPGTSAGELAIAGNYTQSLFGSFLVEIGGTDQGVSFDHLWIDESATLDGDLIVSLFGGFVPDATDAFTILSSRSLAGIFQNASSQIAIMGDVGFFDVTYTDTSVILGNFKQVPEPSAFFYLSVASAIATGLRRRKA